MNKIAIVTGASQGIGRGIALKLAKEGYDIAFSFFSATQRAEELCAEIQSTTAQRCAMYCVDMRKDGRKYRGNLPPLEHRPQNVSSEPSAPSEYHAISSVPRTHVYNILYCSDT